MDKEKQRIKIAEACGYTDIMLPMGFHQEKSDNKSKECGGRWRFEIPNYPEDLNAMHEAEKVLDFNQLKDMEDSVNFQFGVFPFHATAAQRAEAFLRTLNLWEE
jgi:hypothetical protein